MKVNVLVVIAVNGVMATFVFMAGYTAGKSHPDRYRPYGKLTPHEVRAEVLIHKVDPHKIYTCENDPVDEVHSLGDLGHFAVIDQVEALDAGYTPAGQGYCQ